MLLNDKTRIDLHFPLTVLPHIFAAVNLFLSHPLSRYPLQTLPTRCSSLSRIIFDFLENRRFTLLYVFLKRLWNDGHGERVFVFAHIAGGWPRGTVTTLLRTWKELAVAAW